MPDLVDGGPVVGLPAGEPLRIGQLDAVPPEVVARAARGRDSDPGDGQDPPDGRVVTPDGPGVVKARKTLALLGVVDGAAEHARLPAITRCGVRAAEAPVERVGLPFAAPVAAAPSQMALALVQGRPVMLSGRA